MSNSSKTWQNSLHFLTLTACPFKALKKIIFGQFYFMKKLYTNLNICILLIFYKKYVYRFICQQLKSDINSSHSLSPECLIRRDVSLYALKIDVNCISYCLTVSIAVVYVKASQQITARGFDSSATEFYLRESKTNFQVSYTLFVPNMLQVLNIWY